MLETFYIVQWRMHIVEDIKSTIEEIKTKKTRFVRFSTLEQAKEFYYDIYDWDGTGEVYQIDVIGTYCRDHYDNKIVYHLAISTPLRKTEYYERIQFQLMEEDFKEVFFTNE